VLCATTDAVVLRCQYCYLDGKGEITNPCLRLGERVGHKERSLCSGCLNLCTSYTYVRVVAKGRRRSVIVASGGQGLHKPWSLKVVIF